MTRPCAVNKIARRRNDALTEQMPPDTVDQYSTDESTGTGVRIRDPTGKSQAATTRITGRLRVTQNRCFGRFAKNAEEAGLHQITRRLVIAAYKQGGLGRWPGIIKGLNALPVSQAPTDLGQLSTKLFGLLTISITEDLLDLFRSRRQALLEAHEEKSLHRVTLVRRQLESRTEIAMNLRRQNAELFVKETISVRLVKLLDLRFYITHALMNGRVVGLDSGLLR